MTGFLILVIFTFIISIAVSTSRKKYRIYQNALRYAVLIDCGSSGSRIYVYVLEGGKSNNGINNIKRLKHDKKPVENKSDIAISSFIDNPNNAIDFYSEFIINTYKYIPDSEHANTELYILATGGLRMLNRDQAYSLISTLRKLLPAKIKYKIKDIEVISGKLEGIFMWISLNYLSKTLKECSQTHGIIDAGGASIQIAFESESDKRNVEEFKFTCSGTKITKTYHIFSASFDGLGDKAAYEFYSKFQFPPDEQTSIDPCILKRCDQNKVKIKATGSGQPDKCLTRIQRSFNGFFKIKENQNIFDQFKQHHVRDQRMTQMKFYGFGGLWYWFHDFLKITKPLDPINYWDQIKVLFNYNRIFVLLIVLFTCII